MATLTVTIDGFTNADISYSPSPPDVKAGDTVVFAIQDIEGYDVEVSWDSNCPVTDSSDVELNPSFAPSVNRTVSNSASDGPYTFTVTFYSIVPPGTEEEPEEPGPSHGGLEVSR
jgi:plastocyanin